MDVRAISAREAEETLARCVAIAVFYHKSQKSAQRTKIVADDIREVAERLAHSGLDGNEARCRILNPLRSELSSRHGDETTHKLSALFDKILKRQMAIVGSFQQ